MVLVAVCAWDFATPVVPGAVTLEWDDEEEAARGRPRHAHRPSEPRSRRASAPVRAGARAADQRAIVRARGLTDRPSETAVPRPRARLRSAVLASPSEDH